MKNVAILLPLLLAATVHASDVGKRWPSEKTSYVDPVSNLTITVLTKGPSSNAKIYQTHPQWTADTANIIFRSNRAAGGRSQAFAVNEKTGDIVQLTEGNADTGNLNVARKSNRLYYFRNGPTGESLVELELTPLLSDSAAGTMKDPSVYERVVPFPEGMRVSGGAGLDAEENIIYFGVNTGRARVPATTANTPPDTVPATAPASRPTTRRGPIRIIQHPSRLVAMDIHTGKITTVADIPFTIGHIQGNPWASEQVLFCNETGGDAPQRMWYAESDQTGTFTHRPLYIETPDEWVTHECVIDKDHVCFNIMGHLPRLRAKPSGIAVLNLRTNDLRLYGQPGETAQGGKETQGFWHSNGSPDGKWLAGDTFLGNVYLIDRLSGEITLLTTDHKMKPDHTHPTFSPDSSRILIQSGHLTNGTTLDLMTIPVQQVHRIQQPAVAP